MDLEFKILHWFYSLHNPILDKIAIFVTKLGSGGIFWIVLTAVMLILSKKSKKPALTSALALFLSVIMVNFVLKNTVARPRPCWIDRSIPMLVKIPKDFSFPSGHSSASFASATAIFYYYRKQGILLYIIAILIALSRLYLFVHFPTDVLCGTLIGIIDGIFAKFIMKFIYKKYNIKW